MHRWHGKTSVFLFEVTTKPCVCVVARSAAATAWYNIGVSIPGEDETVRVCAREVRCFMRVVELDPTSYDGWINLGNSLFGLPPSVSGGYNSKDCFITALELNRNSSIAWYYLGIATYQCTVGLARVGGKDSTDIGCCVRSVELDPHQVKPWRFFAENFYRVAPSISILIDGVAYSLDDCKRNGLPLYA
eukprot:PhM_4_TR14096/c1_g2_i4/m.92306